MRSGACLAGAIAAAMLAVVPAAVAQPPTTIEIAMGTPDGQKVFVPASLRLPAGQPLRLLLVNQSDNDHTFRAPDLTQHAEMRLVEEESAKAAMQGGIVTVEPHGQAVLELQVGRPGSYEFWCTMPGHAEWGMRGTISIVRPEQN